jgi:sugar phosphate isomerase/epimerase
MKDKPLPPFIISAPTMVFGMDLVENVTKLSQVVTHVEIVLFQTPDLHNIPDEQTINTVKEILAEKNLTCSVHLPASLEVAAEDIRKRNSAAQTAAEIVEHMDTLNPTNYVLHVPITAPTLTAQPGCYIHEHQLSQYDAWSERALRALAEMQTRTGLNQRLLVENINFSPAFLEPLWREGLCAFCLDIGHLLLGRESAGYHLQRYLPVIKEIHLHGVIEWDEHLSLDVLPMERVRAWLQLLEKFRFTDIMNLEVFDPQDLEKSMCMVEAALST